MRWGCGVQAAACRAAGTIADAGAEELELQGALTVPTTELTQAESRDSVARKAEETLRGEAERADEGLRQAYSRAQAEYRLASSHEADASCRAELDIARAALEEADAGMERASEALQHLEQEHLAVAVRHSLTIGRACPVCLHPVTTIPRSSGDVDTAVRQAKAAKSASNKHFGEARTRFAIAEAAVNAAGREMAEAEVALRAVAYASDLAAADAAVHACNERRQAAEDERRAASDALHIAQTNYAELGGLLAAARRETEGLRREQQRVESKLRAHEILLVAAFPGGIPADAAAIFASRKNELQHARAAEDTARETVDRARSDQERVREARRGFESELASLRDGCIAQRARLATIPDLPVADQCPGESPPFVKEIAALAAHAQVGHTALEARGKGVEAERNRWRSELEQAATAAGLAAFSGKPDEVRGAVARAAADVQRTADRAQHRLNDLREKLARRGALEAEMDESRERAGLYRALADELRQDRFIDYILRERAPARRPGVATAPDYFGWPLQPRSQQDQLRSRRPRQRRRTQERGDPLWWRDFSGFAQPGDGAGAQYYRHRRRGDRVAAGGDVHRRGLRHARRRDARHSDRGARVAARLGPARWGHHSSRPAGRPDP